MKNLDNSIFSSQLNEIFNGLVDEEQWQQLLNAKSVENFDINDHCSESLIGIDTRKKNKVNQKYLNINADSRLGVKKQAKRQNHPYVSNFIDQNRLFSNPFFKDNYLDQNTSNQYRNPSSSYYLKQYQKWKKQPQEGLTSEIQKHNNQASSEASIYFPQRAQSKALNCFPQRNRKQMLEKTNKLESAENEELKNGLRQIHEEYLQKMQKITSNSYYSSFEPSKCEDNIPEKAIKQNGTNTDKSKNNGVIDKSSMQKSQFFSNSSQIDQIDQEQPFKEKIEQFCFLSMINSKPNFPKIPKKSPKEQNSITKQKKLDLQMQIREEYLYTSRAESISKGFQKEDINNNKRQSLFLTYQKQKLTKELNTIQNASIHENKMLMNFDDLSQMEQKQIVKQANIMNQKGKLSKPFFRLNIERLLKLPYKDFLIFSDQNRRKIISMTTPDQYKRLQKYQNTCLQHAQSIQKLREKFSSSQGVKLIQQLTVEQKEKLFKVLYEKQLD